MNNITFDELNLSSDVKRAIDEMGFENATEIQYRSIPIIKTGADVIGRSQTGTGKTLAFGIPAIETVATSDEMRQKAQILILCPTRELACQACDEIKRLSKFCYGIKSVAIYGGAPMENQIFQLKRANIVVGTPGRVMDHLRRRTLKLQNLKMIVLDEADEMLNMGFREDIETILKEVPEQRQTILFSATMPPDIMRITKEYQKDAQIIQVNKEKITIDNVEQYFYEVSPSQKLYALYLVLEYHSPVRSIVFCNTKKMVDEIVEFLNKSGRRVDGLHGDMKQAQRTKVMNNFKAGRTSILVATDVAARGIDVSDIDFVFNFDIPQDNEYYVHRIGRTGRAGKRGKAITICGGKRQTYTLMKIAKNLKCYVSQLRLPDENELVLKKHNDNMDKVIEKIESATEFRHSSMVDSLVERGYDAKRIAAAALDMHFKEKNFKLIKSVEIPFQDVEKTHERKSTYKGGYSKNNQNGSDGRNRRRRNKRK